MSRPLRLLVACAIVGAVVAAHVVRRNMPVRGVEVYIEYDGCDTLETAAYIAATIEQRMPALATMRLKEVDTRLVESVVEESPYLVRGRASMSLLGRLVVYARQRRPLLRVYCGSECFYIDDQGVTMPLSPRGASPVTVASGHFKQVLAKGHGTVDLSAWQKDTAKSQYTLVQLWELADFLHRRDNVLDAYDQLYVNGKGDFCLVPSWAHFTVVLGGTDRLEEKMRHLDRFVERVIPVKGWDAYEEVNLKYEGQIVCRKKSE